MTKDVRSVFLVQVFIEPDAQGLSRQDAFQRGPSHRKRIAQIVAVDLDEIERPHEHPGVMPAVPDPIEGCASRPLVVIDGELTTAERYAVRFSSGQPAIGRGTRFTRRRLRPRKGGQEPRPYVRARSARVAPSVRRSIASCR